MRGALRMKRDSFVSCVHSKTDDEGLKTYIANKGLHDFNLTLVSNVNSTFKSYRLSVSINDKDKVLCPEMWPSGMCVQRWRESGNDVVSVDNTAYIHTPHHCLQSSG